MTTRSNDEKTIIYLTNRKIASNMKLVRLYGDKTDFPKEKLFAQNDKMRHIRQLFMNGFITFDETVKSIANDSSIDDDFYQKYK